MSGHSKWATIKRQKGSNDASRGKIFSKLARTIALAAVNGADPENNFKLRLEMDKAHRVNMPKENILRAIKRGSGEIVGEKWEEVTYEAFGPAGTALIIEAVSDNRNRTTAEIKNLLEKNGGRLASPGAVTFQFRRLGQILVTKTAASEQETLFLMDLGVEDVFEREGVLVVLTRPEDLAKIKEAVEKHGLNVHEAELLWQPITRVPVDQAIAERLSSVVTSLEEDDDVQRVFSNVLEDAS